MLECVHVSGQEFLSIRCRMIFCIAQPSQYVQEDADSTERDAYRLDWRLAWSQLSRYHLQEITGEFVFSAVMTEEETYRQFPSPWKWPRKEQASSVTWVSRHVLAW